MWRTVLAAMACAALWIGAPSPARADVLDEVIGFYNPDLKPARPIVECAIGGGNLADCATSAVQAHLVSEKDAALAKAADSTVGQVIELATLVSEKKYHEVVLKAGVVAACAWINEFPGKSLVCSDIGGAVVKAGAELAQAGVGIASDVGTELAKFGADLAEGLADAGNDLYCEFFCSSSGSSTTISVDVQREWNECFQARIADGLRARLAGGSVWASWVSATVGAEGYFPSNSLVGACANAGLQAMSAHPPVPKPGSLWSTGGGGPIPSAPTPAATAQSEAAMRSYVAQRLQPIYWPMLLRYRDIIDASAVVAVQPAADRYAVLQGQEVDRARAVAADNFLTPMMAMVMSVHRAQCRSTLQSDTATYAMAAWAQAGGSVGAGASVNGRTGQQWLAAEAPQPWCQTGFTAAYNESAQARRTAYQEAIAGGCTTVRADAWHLSCTAQTTAAARCLNAFAGGSRGKCDVGAAAPLQVRNPGALIQNRAPPSVAPPSVAPPATTTATPTPQPAPPAPAAPRLRIPMPPVAPPSPQK